MSILDSNSQSQSQPNSPTANSPSSNQPPSNTPLILCADTSTARAGIALANGTELLGLLGLAGGERRSRQLLSEVDWLLSKLERRIDEIDAFAVITGPGGFTGLRVGIATIKGFAHALARPVVGLSSLETFARAAGVSSCTCVMLDAHRGEVFAQLFAVDDNAVVTPLSEVVITEVATMLAEIRQFQREQGLAQVVFAGDGAILHLAAISQTADEQGIAFQAAKLLTARAPGWIVQSPPAFLVTDAVYFAREKFLRGELIAADQLAAHYIRPAEAEVKLRLGLLGKKRDASLQT